MTEEAPRGIKLEMTPDRRERMKDIGTEVYTILRGKAESPIEALVILDFIQDYLEEMIGASYEGTVWIREDPGNA